MSYSRENNEVNISNEDRVNAMRGYKATMNNPRVSNEAKEHAGDVLDNELHGDQPREELYNVRGQNKEPTRVAGGLKAAQQNPRNTAEGKKAAGGKLDQLAHLAQPEE